MADPTAIIKQIFEAELVGVLSLSLGPYIASQGGVQSDSSSGIRWTIEETEANTFTHQPTTPEIVFGHQRKDGTHVDRYERKATPIKVPINENLAGLDSALDRGITLAVQKIQSRV